MQILYKFKKKNLSIYHRIKYTQLIILLKHAIQQSIHSTAITYKQL